MIDDADDALVWTRVQSPLGSISLAASPLGLAKLHFEGDGSPAQRSETMALATSKPHANAHAHLAAAKAELSEYFAGARRQFDVNLVPSGTAFDHLVWAALREIPHGATLSYGELARQLGRPGAARAVGHANGRNPLAIIVPCHRVIASDGSLGGYAGGLDLKRALLALEFNGAIPSPSWSSSHR